MKVQERSVLATRVARHRDVFRRSFREIACSLLIPLSTVHRWYVSRTQSRSRRGLLERAQECITEVTNTNVCRTLDDIRRIMAKRGLAVSNSTISRAAAREVSKRKVYPFKPVNQGITELRESFSKFVTNNPNLWDDFISIDECAVYLNCNRQSAWYKRGPKLRAKDDNNGSRIKVSLIMAVHPKHGVIHCKVIPGNYNKVEFGGFLRELHEHLPKCMSSPLLLMDNVAFHKSKETTKMYSEFNMRPIFVPPYTSEWNPIERVFHMVKSKFRSLVDVQLLKDRQACLHRLSEVVRHVHENQIQNISNIYTYVKSIVTAMQPLGRASVILSN
jgi:DDE superfamily endonuclease